MISDEQYRSIACPICPAKIGEACMTHSGNGLHYSRMHAVHHALATMPRENTVTVTLGRSELRTILHAAEKAHGSRHSAISMHITGVINRIRTEHNL